MTIAISSRYFGIFGLIFTLVGCDSGGGNSENSGAATHEDFSQLLADTVNNVIVPTYTDLHDKANDLQQCVQTLEVAPTDTQLTACQNAWIAARVPWEQSEGFLFGPVTDQGLDPAMDSWPVDHQQLEALLASNVTLSADTITSNLGGGMKGFHTIEYLLWGMDHNRIAVDLATAPREREYLIALTEALAADTLQLRSAWVGTANDVGYGQRFMSAGKAQGLYSSQLDAVQELIGGMLDICNEVAFGKIAEPYKARDPNLIESQFSYNSLLDFADNIRSVRNIYFASLDQSRAANSLSRVVAKFDADLDVRVANQIESAIAAILAIGIDGLTFREAILNPRYDAAIDRAQSEIAALMDTLNGEIMPLFAR